MGKVIGGSRVLGIPELNAKLTPQLVAGASKKFLLKWGVYVQSRAREKAPINKGRLRGDITYELDSEDPHRTINVGTRVEYAPEMEGGTGLFAELEGAKGGRHWPPGAALDDWASRHGFNSGQEVANIIGRRGGLLPRRFLRGAEEDAQPKLDGWLSQMARDIEKENDIGSK